MLMFDLSRSCFQKDILSMPTARRLYWSQTLWKGQRLNTGAKRQKNRREKKRILTWSALKIAQHGIFFFLSWVECSMSIAGWVTARERKSLWTVNEAVASWLGQLFFLSRMNAVCVPYQTACFTVLSRLACCVLQGTAWLTSEHLSPSPGDQNRRKREVANSNTYIIHISFFLATNNPLTLCSIPFLPFYLFI